MRKGGNRSENAKNGVYDGRKPAAGEKNWGYMFFFFEGVFFFSPSLVAGLRNMVCRSHNLIRPP